MSPTPIEPHPFQFTSADGLRIACTRWEGRGPAAGVVQIAHGLGEHIGRYTALIESLVTAGFVVYGNDHRGHGRTAPSPKHFGDFGPGGFDLLVEDMAQLSRIAKAEHPECPVLLLGHSMGSFAAQQYVLERSAWVDGLALSGSGALDGLVSLAHSGKGAPSDLMNAAFEPVRTPSDWLSRDPAVVDAFLKDPLCFGWLQPAAAESFFAAAPRLADPGQLGQIRHHLPVYVFSGTEDPVGQQLAGVSVLIGRYRAAGVSNISYDFYPGGRHETLNEINRDEVRANLLRWVSEVLSGSGVTVEQGGNQAA
jgi:alpha-beta hydrolase superfamily lysophospholipase